MLKRKTFIHHGGALGDLLLSLPCVRAIKADSGYIHLAGRPDVVGLLRDASVVDEASSTDSCLYASLYTERAEEKTAEFLAQFERAFVFTTRGESLLAANIGMIVPRTETIITVPCGETRTHVAHFRLKQLGVHREQDYLVTKLDIPSAYTEKAKNSLVKAGYADDRRPLIALHPGSGSGRKCWPLENYFALIERMMENLDPFCILFSGLAESPAIREKIKEFARRHKRILPVCDEQLSTVAALLSLCDLYVGNDSGISHLAAAVNGNVIALYGPTDPLLWRPVGQKVRSISAGAPPSSLLSITVNEVYETLRLTSPISGIYQESGREDHKKLRSVNFVSNP